jgi:hypothetical protein
MVTNRNSGLDKFWQRYASARLCNVYGLINVSAGTIRR